MRHGEVDNPTGVLYERLPGFHLSERGRAMTAQTAQFLADTHRDITYLVASPLERAQESAAPVSRAFDLPIATDERLIEAGSNFAGRSIHRDRSTLWHPRSWPNYVNPLRPSWGEPYREIAQRMRRAVVAALRQARGHEAVLVSHQLPIWTLRRWAEGRVLWHDPRQRECALASLTSLHFEGATLVQIEYTSPAADLVAEASDMTPGTSGAGVNRG